LWTIAILRGLGYGRLAPISSLEDNPYCIEYSKSNSSHDKSNKSFGQREKIQQKNFLVVKISTKDNVT